MSAHESRPAISPDFESSADDSSALHQRVLSLRLPRQEASHGTGSAKAAWGLVVLLVIVVGVLAALLLQRGSPETLVTVSQEKPPAEAQAASSGNIVLDSKGYIMPVQRILVSPKVSGMIVKLDILEGRRVKKGAILAELEDVDYQADLAHAESFLESARQRLAEIVAMWPKEIGQAKAELERAKAELAQLKSDFVRSKELYFNQKALSQLDYELAESKYRSNDQRVRSLEFALGLLEASRGKKVAAAEAEVRQDEADLAKARWRLDNCKIRAPISGTILRKNAEEGNLVNPIAMNGSYSLCDLADLSDLEVELTIEERDISKVTLGQKCKVRTEAYPERIYEGVVSRLMPIADRNKAAIPVRVKVTVPKEEEGIYLKPDMTAMVSFLKDSSATEKASAKNSTKKSSPLMNP
ncbi:MAG: HlyD family secretion protein [Thermoguttaceae bacterium]